VVLRALGWPGVQPARGEEETGGEQRRETAAQADLRE
jgi:hypothetical protein